MQVEKERGLPRLIPGDGEIEKIYLYPVRGAGKPETKKSRRGKKAQCTCSVRVGQSECLLRPSNSSNGPPKWQLLRRESPSFFTINLSSATLISSRADFASSSSQTSFLSQLANSELCERNAVLANLRVRVRLRKTCASEMARTKQHSAPKWSQPR